MSLVCVPILSINVSLSLVMVYLCMYIYLLLFVTLMFMYVPTAEYELHMMHNMLVGKRNLEKRSDGSEC